MIVRAAEPSDQGLVARAAAGDGAAFEALVVRYQHRVFRLACRRTRETDAPDIMQDAFLQIYRHISAFRGGALFSTWLYRIVISPTLASGAIYLGRSLTCAHIAGGGAGSPDFA